MSTPLPDFVVAVDDLVQNTFVHRVTFPNTSCVFKEQCVGKPGRRNLLRFTSTAINQGRGDYVPVDPKTNVNDFEWGTCHQHYHMKAFMEFNLLTAYGVRVLKGHKAGYCLEDSRRELNGADIACDKKYDCANQGIQAGWADSYGWSLDCSWLDVTDLIPGSYIIHLAVNPERRIDEESYTNNLGCVRVNIPNNDGFTDVPRQLTDVTAVSCPTIVNSAGKMSFFAALLAAVIFIIIA
jgi:hypothetical protein